MRRKVRWGSCGMAGATTAVVMTAAVQCLLALARDCAGVRSAESPRRPRSVSRVEPHARPTVRLGECDM